MRDVATSLALQPWLMRCRQYASLKKVLELHGVQSVLPMAHGFDTLCRRAKRDRVRPMPSACHVEGPFVRHQQQESALRLETEAKTCPFSVAT